MKNVKNEEFRKEDDKKIEIKNVYTYFISYTDGRNQIIREIYNVGDPIKTLDSFKLFEDGLKKYKKNDAITVIAFSLMDVQQKVFYNDILLDANKIKTLELDNDKDRND